MPTTRYYFPIRGAGAGAGTPAAPVAVPYVGWNATGSAIRTALLAAPPVGTRAGSGVGVDGSTYTVGQRALAGQFVGPALPAGVITGTFRGVFRLQGGHTLGFNALTLTVKVVTNDGATVRGVLVAAATAAVASDGEYHARVVGPVDMGTVAAHAGDRLVVEVGAVRQSGGIPTGATILFNDDATLSDYAFTNGAVAADGRCWVELIIPDPPLPPTDLVAYDVGSDSATVSWTPPATGTAPTSYEYRVNGGPAVSVGLSTSVILYGLEADTPYTVEVRSVAAPGASVWSAPLAFATPSGAAYRVVVRLGSHVWDVLAEEPPELGPTLPLSFGWAVPEDSLGFPAQPDPDLCNLGLVTADGSAMFGVDIGTTMRVSIYTDASSTARPLATFRGRVADLEAAPHRLGLIWRLLGVGYTADTGSRQVGAGEWPQESGDARAARIMAEAGLSWSSDAIGTTWEARQPQAVTARSLLDDLTNAAVTTEGTAYGPARRVLAHPVTDANGELTAFAGSAVVRRTDALDFITAGLVNRATTWRRTKLLDATWVKIDHPGGPTVYGDPRGPAYPPLSVSVLDPRELAELVLDTTPGYRWLTGDALRLELWADDGPALAVVSQWFYRDPDSDPFPWSGRAVIVEGIERTPDGSTSHAGMLAAATLRLEHNPTGLARLAVEFRLRPEIPADSTVTMRWMDEPVGESWADELAEDPTGTWRDYYTRPRP